MTKKIIQGESLGEGWCGACACLECGDLCSCGSVETVEVDSERVCQECGECVYFDSYDEWDYAVYVDSN
jgi:hypothetical protein